MTRQVLLSALFTTSIAAQQTELERKYITFDQTTNVRVPGRITWAEGMTLRSAIAAAGGPGFLSRLGIVREGKRLGPYSLRLIKGKRNPTVDPKLFPGDIITAWD